MDYRRHNEEVRRVWNAYHSGNPIRVPMILGLSSRFYLLDESLNRQGITYQQYFDSPQVMLETQCRFQRHIRMHVHHDIEMGIPEEGWTVAIDFQNIYDAAWFGCEILYVPGQCPDTRPRYPDENFKEGLLESPPPAPFYGLMGRVREYLEFFLDQKRSFRFEDKPIKEVICQFPLFTDGPFTLGCQLRGTENFCADMILDEDYYHRVMQYLTDALIARSIAWREYLGHPMKSEMFLADDYVQLLSKEHYAKSVLPYHRRLYEAFSDHQKRSIHLCGDATRHFPLIQSELRVRHFDTGYPVDFGAVRQALGTETEISGGPHIELLLNGSPASIRERTGEILQSGIMHGGKFILREGNNLAPKTPLQNIEAMYQACREYGKY